MIQEHEPLDIDGFIEEEFKKNKVKIKQDVNTLIHDTNGYLGRILTNVRLVEDKSDVKELEEDELYKRLKIIRGCVKHTMSAIDALYSKSKEWYN